MCVTSIKVYTWRKIIYVFVQVNSWCLVGGTTNIKKQIKWWCNNFLSHMSITDLITIIITMIYSFRFFSKWQLFLVTIIMVGVKMLFLKIMGWKENYKPCIDGPRKWGKSPNNYLIIRVGILKLIQSCLDIQIRYSIYYYDSKIFILVFKHNFYSILRFTISSIWTSNNMREDAHNEFC